MEDCPEEARHHCDGSLFPRSTLVPVTIICLLLFLVGAAGNAVTVLVVCRLRQARTTTDLYLSSMAVSDLAVFLSLPFDLYRLWRYVPWIFGDLACRLSHYINESCTYATVLHITGLSAERYLAVCFPLRAKALASRRRARRIILSLWAVALISATPVLLLVGVEQGGNSTHPDGSSRQCTSASRAAASPGLLRATVWVSTTYFFGPMLCLTVLYGAIAHRLWKGKSNLPDAPCRERSNRKTVRLLAALVMAFAVCWLPFHVGRHLFAGADDYLAAAQSQDFNVASMVLFYLSAAINPVLYSLMSHRYRAAAQRLLLRPSPCQPRPRPPGLNDTPSGNGSFPGL